MIRFKQALATAVTVLVAPTMASALGIEIVNVVSSGADTHSLQNGDEITFDLRLSNPTHEDVYGLDIVVTGFDEPNTTPANSSGLELMGGQLATSVFNSLYIAGVPNVNGLANTRTEPVTVWAPSAQFPQPLRTSLFAGAALTPANGDGSQDNGVLGGQTGLGDIHFRVTYRLVVNNSGPSQDLLLSFGTDSALGHPAIGAGGVELPFQNATWALTVVPEPGTALLMGLGLAGLALRRR